MNMDRDDVRGISDTHLSAVASCCPRRLPMSQTRGRATPGTSNWVKVEATTSLGHLRSRLPSLWSPTNTQKTFDASAWNFHLRRLGGGWGGMMRGRRRRRRRRVGGTGQLPPPGESSLAGCPLPSSAAAAAKLPTPKSGVTTPSPTLETLMWEQATNMSNFFGEHIKWFNQLSSVYNLTLMIMCDFLKDNPKWFKGILDAPNWPRIVNEIV